MSPTFIKTECRSFALFKDYAKPVNTTLQKKLCQVELELLVQQPSTPNHEEGPAFSWSLEDDDSSMCPERIVNSILLQLCLING